MTKEEKKEYMRLYRFKNKDRIKEQVKRYHEKKAEPIKQYQKKYREENKEKIKELNKKYYSENKEYLKQKRYEYYNTMKGRAQMICQCCKAYDRRANRPKGDLTAQWILENILTKPCVYCGETDWRKIGCNRIDNSKAHTIDNVEPCCYSCNVKLPRKQY